MLTEEEKGFLNAPDINQVKDFLSNAFKNKNNVKITLFLLISFYFHLFLYYLLYYLISLFIYRVILIYIVI